MSEYVILVDKNDNPIGTEEKVKCHLPNGKLHRAFTALIFDKQNRLLLGRRSSEKMLWPGDWDGTFASHPRESETYVSSGERRMPEEMGIIEKVDYFNKFEYHVEYKDIGSENEICATLVSVVDRYEEENIVKDEISKIKWISSDLLASELKINPEIYCPWMIIALYYIADTSDGMKQKYEKLISEWTKDGMKEVLEKSIQVHIKDKNWRLLKQ